MIDKKKLREYVSAIIELGSPNYFRHIDEEVRHSKEFIQKIYKKDSVLFNWLPLYLKDRVVWEEVKEEQEKILLGNAFNKFCHNAKLISPKHNINLDDMTHKEMLIFKAFKQLYDQNKISLDCLLKVSDYVTYNIVPHLDSSYIFDMNHYVAMKGTKSFTYTLETMAKDAISEIEKYHVK